MLAMESEGRMTTCNLSLRLKMQHPEYGTGDVVFVGKRHLAESLVLQVTQRHEGARLSKDVYAFTIHAIWEAVHEKRTQVSVSKFQSFTEI